MDLLEPFQCVLGIELKEDKRNLFVFKVGVDIPLNDGEVLMRLLSKDSQVEKRLLVVDIKPPKDHHIALEQKFTFNELEILTLRDDQSPFTVESKQITIADIRELVHELSVCYSGKTFTERDFNSAVFMQAADARDDNRNQDECFNDASVTILYLFLYGFLEDILTKNGNLCYNADIKV